MKMDKREEGNLTRLRLAPSALQAAVFFFVFFFNLISFTSLLRIRMVKASANRFTPLPLCSPTLQELSFLFVISRAFVSPPSLMSIRISF